MFNKYILFLENILSKLGLSEGASNFISEGISLVTLILITLIIYHLVLFIIRKTIYIFIEKSASKKDDILIKNKVFKRLTGHTPGHFRKTIFKGSTQVKSHSDNE